MSSFYLRAANLGGLLVCFFAIILVSASAQTPAKPAPPDVLVLVDGEKLIGHFESATATQVLFKSDLAGEVKVDWAKVQDLQSSAKFAIAHKGQVFGRHIDPTQVPQGAVAVADQKVTVTPAAGAPLTVPVADTANVIPQDNFLRAFSRPKLREYWTGAAGLGFSLVDSNQNSRTLTSTLGLVRTVPSESWIAPRYRTTITFNSAYGTTTSDGETIKTDIIHGGVEQDEYLNPRLFAFGQGTVDHNYSQGLKVSYTVGGGLGFVAYKDAHQELDIKGQIAYTNQVFSIGNSTHLIGAVASEDYNRSFAHGITLHEEISVTPSFNIFNDYSANGLLNLGLPITKKINFTVGLQDSFLNDPPPSFKKNSFQFVTNVTYKIN